MNNPFSLEGKTVLVTGASSGIGKSIAIECSKMGAKVIASGRNNERLIQTLSELEGEGHYFICADLSKDGDIDMLIDKLIDKIDGVVQCAGFTISKPFQFFSKENVKDVMGVNFEAPFFLTQLLVKKKKINKGASIVFISSISGPFISSVAGALYSASKGAVDGVAKGLALELASKNIRVNCVNPGMVDTEIFSAGIITKEQLEEDTKKYPLKRYGKPQDVAYATIYLLSDASSWVTGTDLKIDGGYTLL